ncbi:efflux RND transporter periplasmic adaptor subunit [Lentibacillus sp. N15]|uniref:efflux RND transporter periplasmic adaptor subunit n=1 Tax=Lentibacillus songyuanensis TaxID=3136161 RepID=UPI0031BBCA80
MKKVGLALMVIVVGLLAACSSNDDTKEDKGETATPVETAKVEQGDLVTKKMLYGRTAPASTTPVMVEIPGEITALKVANGDKVAKDDLIATISGQHIYASKEGVITNLSADEGSMVSNSDPLAVIADLDILKIQMNVTADEMDLLNKDDTHKAVIDGKKIQAKISSMDKVPNDMALFPVEATFDNDDGKLLPGEVAKLAVPQKKVKDALIVPTAAIVQENGQSFVFIRNNDTVTKTEVTVTETQSDQSAVKGDLKKGMEVVISGQQSLDDGSKVKVVKAGNPS